MTYSGADAWGRYRRMCGDDVFQPIGFDAFGINAENYALRTGEHPRSLIARTVTTYREQLRSLDCAWDWQAEIVTSDPSYYRWTQWVFLQLLRAGLAYRAEAPVVWCPSCATVLAREQTEHGRCERCGTAVVERRMTQWFLRITAYAERLTAGLDGLDWPEKAKNRQRRWIEGMHDWLISRQRYWGPPIPVVHCRGCGVVPVPEGDLPVVLPHLDDFRPTGTGESPLASAPDRWLHVPCPACGAPARRETDVSDTFFDSAWYFLRYPSHDVHDRPWDPERTARWLPVGQYAGGPEHVARHHLYARFVTMAMHDLGLLDFDEPFPRLRLHGMLTMHGEKMSKSRGNVVNPDELVATHGADVARLALLFGRPWDADGEWEPAVVPGVERFLARVRRLAAGAPSPGDGGEDDPAVARAVERVGDAIEHHRFNVAIAALMEVVRRVRSADDRRRFALALAPLAPTAAEALWAATGGAASVHDQRWPAEACAHRCAKTGVRWGQTRNSADKPVGTKNTS
jgi:leucyl-tRNA synthetase